MVGRRLATPLEKARRQNATIFLIDECGLLLAPLVRRTLAPSGRTPILSTRAKWREKVSMIAALGVWPRTQRLNLHFRSYPRQYINNHKVADFLCALLRQVRGKIIIVWDGGNMHKGDPIRAVLRRTRRVHLERFPAYSPDLNPVEYLWKHLKFDKMANYCPLRVEQINKMAKYHLRRIAATQDRLRQFVLQSKLPKLLPQIPRHLKSEDQ